VSIKIGGRLRHAQSDLINARVNKRIDSQGEYAAMLEDTMKSIFLQGILEDQDGQDTLEWVAIAALIVLVAVSVMAIVRSKAISGAEAITW
jgi:hypothetical protein